MNTWFYDHQVVFLISVIRKRYASVCIIKSARHYCWKQLTSLWKGRGKSRFGRHRVHSIYLSIGFLCLVKYAVCFSPNYAPSSAFQSPPSLCSNPAGDIMCPKARFPSTSLGGASQAHLSAVSLSDLAARAGDWLFRRRRGLAGFSPPPHCWSVEFELLNKGATLGAPMHTFLDWSRVVKFGILFMKCKQK